MVRAAVAALLCVACQGQSGGRGAGSALGSGAGTGSGQAVGSAVAASPVGSGGGGADARGSAGGAAGGESDARGKADEPEPADPGRIIADLGAMPAWQAVVDRAQLLARRGQHGVVYGRVGPAVLVPGPTSLPAGAGAAPAPAPAPGSGSGASGAPGSGSGVAPGSGSAAVAGPGTGAPPANDAGLVASPYVWLVDDTEGNGALGIRIALGDKAKEGDRIAAGGAWQLDTERRWYWKPDTIQILPPAPPSDLKEPPAPVPSHAIATGPLPPGARTAGFARDGDLVYFQIVGPPPATEGDGWQVADELGNPPALVMNLPGERPSYGGQDMRAADERWLLRRGQTYWVRIGRLHKRADKPPTVNARTAPVRVP